MGRAKHSYQALKGALENQINNYVSIENRAVSKINNLNGEIVELKERISNNRSAIRNKTQLLKNATNELRTTKHERALRVAKRTEELKVIAKVETIFKTKFSKQVRSYVSHVKI